MRKQRQVLKHVTDFSAPDGHIEVLFGIKENPVSQRNPSSIRRTQSGNTVEERGFPRSRWSKQNRDARRHRKLSLQLKSLRQPLADANFQARGLNLELRTRVFQGRGHTFQNLRFVE